MFYIKAAGGTNGAELQIYKLGKDNQGDLKSRTNETKLKIWHIIDICPIASLNSDGSDGGDCNARCFKP